MDKPKVEVNILNTEDRKFLVHVRLSPGGGDRQFLLFVAERGGEIEFDKSKVAKHVNDRITEFVVKGLLTETPLIGRSRNEVLYRLTDMGRNLCSVMLNGGGS